MRELGSIWIPFRARLRHGWCSEAVGDGVTRFVPGARVISNFMPAWIDGRPGGSAQEPSYRTLGGYHEGVVAEYVSFPEGWFTAAPARLDYGEASTLPVAGLTVWFSFIEMGRLRAGETVLLSGTGGVAMFALQIAVTHGAEVLITSSSDEKLRRAKTLGVAHGINPNAADVVQEVLSITRGRGADRVLGGGGW